MKSVYHRGADNGFFIGAYLVILSVMLVMGLQSSVCNIVSLALITALPPACYLMLRKTYTDEKGKTTFSAMWVQGIVAFACGAIILALVTYIYLRWINPGFIAQQVHLAIETYEKINDDSAREIATLFRHMEEQRAYPTPQQIILQLIFLTTSLGSLLSMLTALFIRIRGYRKPKN